MSNDSTEGQQPGPERALEALLAARRQGSSQRDLESRLGLDSQEPLLGWLRELQRQGEAVEWNRRWFAIRHTDWRVGRIEVQRGGQGVVSVGEGGEAGYFVRRGDLNGARDGDLVLVKPRKKAKGKRAVRDSRLPLASVSRVLERRWNNLVGRVVPWHSGYCLEPFDTKVRIEVDLGRELPDGARPGDYVVADLLDKPGRHSRIAGRISEVLGDVDEPGVDVDVVLRHLQIPDAFPPDVLAQAAEFGEDPEESDMKDRLDLRDRVTVTIDGVTAKDFDDAISVESRPGGGFRLGVHIADVSHYVSEGSRLDREALHRGTSVYFPDRAVPMLPEALSNGLCSLRPDVPRLTVSAFLDIDSDGQVGRRRFASSVIQSRRRLTYGEVRRVLEEPQDGDREDYGEVLDLLHHANDLRKALYRRRIADGSLDLDLPEVNLILGDAGEVTAIEPAERNVAHRLIEELMIAANSAVAAEVDSNEVPAMHRVHPPPDLETLEELRTALAAIGLKFEVTREALHPSVLQRLLSDVEGDDHQALVSNLVLRSLQRAVYNAEPAGHFALSLRDYAHFTSPIRRYPDLTVHRQLKRLLSGAEDLDAGLHDRLPAMAEHCSQTERRAERAERDVSKWKKVRYLEDFVGEIFPGTVTGVAPFGLFVQLDDFLVDGLIPIRSLTDDYYHFEPDHQRLLGERRGRIFRLGDRLEVILAQVKVSARTLDFEIPGMPPPRRERRSKPPRSLY